MRFIHADGDLELNLKDSDGLTLDTSATSSDDEFAEVLAEADGQVWIRVYSYLTNSNGYSLEISVEPFDCTEDAHEPNSLAEGADAATISVPFDEMGLTLCGESDEDWFTFELLADKLYRFDALFLHDLGNVDLYLYAADNLTSSIASATSYSDNEAFEYTTDSAGGTYYLRVKLWSSLEQAYDLKIDLPECSVDADCGALQACVLGFCTDVQCLETGDCAGLQICTDYACVDVDCVTDGDCTGVGEICVSNACLLPAQGESCANPILVDSFPYTVAGFAVDEFMNDMSLSSSSCTGYGTVGKDVVFEVALFAGQTLSASLTTPDYDGALWVTDQCGLDLPDDACLDGADADYSGGTETVSYTATADGIVYVVVDYFSTGPTTGTFDLTIDIAE